MVETKKISQLILPMISKDISYYEKKYPKRKLEKGQIVTRFAPSPTGFLHIGSLYSAFISSVFAQSSNGIAFLRIEDTDKKREVENGIEGIVSDLNDYEIKFHEGATYGGKYGSYIQSERKEIYQTFAKYLLDKGLAYPCFETEEELSKIREEQTRNKQRLGYYGNWAISKFLSFEEIEKKLKQGIPFTIRLKSPGNYDTKITHYDLIKGRVDFPENDLDVVILKSDGLPTYHFAHLVDDYLMGTTHVIRGDEWLSSIPLHLQLFEAFGFEPPRYAHLAPILKSENNSKRKISKRKDEEAAMSYYHEQGIPVNALKIYLATLTNTNFEEWYHENSEKQLLDFEFTFEKMNISGALFDLDKLTNISKTYFSHLSGAEIYDGALIYYEEYDQGFYNLLKNKKDYSIALFNIERYIKKPRKDIGKYKDIKEIFWYLYDELYFNQDFKKSLIDNLENLKHETIILDDYLENYFDASDEKANWFEKIRELAIKYNYAPNIREYKKEPNKYNGHVGNIAEFIRFALTFQKQTPDLYEILKLLGKESIVKRFNKFKEEIKTVE